MLNYFNNIMYPYPSMQQLNLDWIMQRVGETPQTIQLPALPTSYAFSDLGALIDDNTDLIPVGFSILLFGNPLTDATGLCGSALIWKKAATDAFFYFFGSNQKLWFAYRFANTPWIKFGAALTPLT